MKKKTACIIMDWAGTAVDYGCFAPVAAFVESFKAIGAPVTAAETRAHMGLTKLEEIRALFAIPRVGEDFRRTHGRDFTEADVEACYATFQDVLMATLDHYAAPLPGVVETMDRLRAKGLRIGSTTGYTTTMMDVVRPAAERRGYRVDACFTADGLPGGRPRPYMVYRNLCALDVADRRAAIKVGDTVADVREGVNAGVWSVGVIMGSNELALTEAEAAAMPAEELATRVAAVRHRLYAAGADYVIDRITDLPDLIDCIDARMNF